MWRLLLRFPSLHCFPKETTPLSTAFFWDEVSLEFWFSVSFSNCSHLVNFLLRVSHPKWNVVLLLLRFHPFPYYQFNKITSTSTLTPYYSWTSSVKARFNNMNFCSTTQLIYDIIKSVSQHNPQCSLSLDSLTDDLVYFSNDLLPWFACFLTLLFRMQDSV